MRTHAAEVKKEKAASHEGEGATDSSKRGPVVDGDRVVNASYVSLG